MLFADVSVKNIFNNTAKAKSTTPGAYSFHTTFTYLI